MITEQDARDLLALLQNALGPSAIPANAVNISTYSGAIGDGVVDDTLRVQQVLTYCSDNNLACYIPAHKKYLITRELFLWGGCSIYAEPYGEFYFNVNVPYVINVGIKGRQILAPVWNGRIQGVTFRVLYSGTSRLMFFWRSDGATLHNNTFYFGNNRISATSSGNNNNFVVNGDLNCIRKNLTITNNKIFAESDQNGSEGFGLNQWDTALIKDNMVYGVGDDMLGIHFCKNVTIQNNTLSGVDGRLFVAQSANVLIENNDVTRMQSLETGQFHAGIALLYIGHEYDTTNGHSAPTDITIRNNRLTYPIGSVDTGSAIYIYAPRNVVVDANVVSCFSTAILTGLHILPFVYTAPSVWTDPAALDTDNIGRVRALTVSNNNLSNGTVSLPLKQTGQTCAYYVGPVTITGNRAKSFSFICNPTTANNTVVP